jgi:hypothetical protein
VDRELAARPRRLTPDFSARKRRASERGTDLTARERRNRLAAQLTLVAAVWSLGLVIAAVALPVDNTTSPSPDGTTFVTKTLVAGQGAWVLIPVVVPLVITGVVALALRRKRAGAGAGAGTRAGRIAWAAIALLTAFALFSILSIGGFVLPVAIVLACAARLSRAEAAPTGQDRGPRARPA